MKIRFGHNDVVDTKDLGVIAEEVTDILNESPMGDSQSIEKLLLLTLLDQATKMSSAEDQALLTGLTGRERLELMEELNDQISLFKN